MKILQAFALFLLLIRAYQVLALDKRVNAIAIVSDYQGWVGVGSNGGTETPTNGLLSRRD